MEAFNPAELLRDVGPTNDADDLRQRLERLVAQSRRLMEQNEEQERENYEISEYFRQDIAAKNEQLQALDSKFRGAQQQHKAELAQLEETWEARERSARVTAANVENSLKDQISDLQAQLEVLRSFQDERDALQRRIKQLEDDNMNMKAAFPEQIRQLELKHMQSEAELKADFESKLEQLKRTAEMEVEQQLDASIKRIFKQSLQLKQEVALHVEASSKLQQELTHVADSKSELVRDAELAAQREEEYAKRTAYLSGELSNAKARVEALEQSVAQLVVEFERQRKALQERAAAELAAAHKERDSLKRMVRLQEQELARIRKTASQLAGGRGVVELFLHTAIQQVQEEIRQSGRLPPAAAKPPATAAGPAVTSASAYCSTTPILQRRSSNAGPTSRRGSNATAAHDLSGLAEDAAAGPLRQLEPLIREGPTAASKTKEVDIRDLSWPERERVLRLLFAQIRGLLKEQPTPHLPAHPMPTREDTEEPYAMPGLAALGAMADLA